MAPFDPGHGLLAFVALATQGFRRLQGSVNSEKFVTIGATKVGHSGNLDCLSSRDAVLMTAVAGFFWEAGLLIQRGMTLIAANLGLLGVNSVTGGCSDQGPLVIAAAVAVLTDILRKD
jgi:hypothetical protein